MRLRHTTLLVLLIAAALALRPRGPESVLAGAGSGGAGGEALAADEASVAATAELLGAAFKRFETEHFVILSDGERAWTQARAALLERANHQFERLMGRLGLPVSAPESKLLCVLINDYAAYAAFARTHDGVTAPWVAGYYAAFSNRAVFFNDATSPQFQRARADASREPGGAARVDARAAAVTIAKTLHEAFHLIAFNRGLQSRARQAPFWLTEGVAACFESESPNRAFGPDHGVEKREAEFRALLREGRLIPLEALVAMNAAPPEDDEIAGVMYAQSYALVRYLFRHRRDELAAFFRDLQREPPGLMTARRHGEMFAARFGDPREVEKAFLRAMSREAVSRDASIP